MPGFTCLVYNNPVAGINDADVAMTAAVDPDFTQDGSGNYRFSEQYGLIGAAMFGASVLEGKLDSPQLNAIGRFDIFAANRGLNPVASTWMDWYLNRPIPIPMYESISVKDNNNLGASSEIENAVLLLQAQDGLFPVPNSGMMMRTKVTGTTTWTLNAWQTGVPLTFKQNPRGGVYSVIGAIMQSGNAVAFRINFPRYRPYMGQRKLRPGGPVQNAVGNVPPLHKDWQPGMLGEWGRFWTQEPPTLDVFGTAASSTPWVLYLDLIYLGNDPSLLLQGAGGGSPAIAQAMPSM